MSSAQTAADEGSTTKEPVHKIAGYVGGGRVEVAIWENEAGERVRHDVSVGRSYKDDDGYKNVKSFRQQDLPTLSHLLMQAYDWIAEQG